MPDHWLDAADVAAALDLSTAQVYAWFRSGTTPFRVEKFGQRYRVARPDLERYLREGTSQSAMDIDALQTAFTRALVDVLADHNLRPELRFRRIDTKAV